MFKDITTAQLVEIIENTTRDEVFITASAELTRRLKECPPFTTYARTRPDFHGNLGP
jgi:hypothetical protein